MVVELGLDHSMMPQLRRETRCGGGGGAKGAEGLVRGGGR